LSGAACSVQHDIIPSLCPSLLCLAQFDGFIAVVPPTEVSFVQQTGKLPVVMPRATRTMHNIM
jgi:hypothetical protein